jgi:stage V sporulation protein G
VCFELPYEPLIICKIPKFSNDRRFFVDLPVRVHKKIPKRLNNHQKSVVYYNQNTVFSTRKYFISKLQTKINNGGNKMKITDVKVRKLFDEGPMKAIVSVTFDGQLAVHDIKVINARDKFFIVMPSRKNPDETYRDIVHPINSDFRSALEADVIAAYKEALENAQNAQSTEDFVPSM